MLRSLSYQARVWLAALMMTAPAMAEDQAVAFQPPGMWIWDNWFAHDGERWHAYYLQLPKAVGMERRWKNNDLFKHVGHATSKDLREWKDCGPALTALTGTWNDRHIATGCVVQHEGKWHMIFTGRGTQGDAVGLALSPDLMEWKTEEKPLFPLIDTFGMEAEGSAVFESVWQGQKVRWAGISDPYVLPEKLDGWYYLVLCSRILGEPIATSGCLTVLRSKDLRKWEQPEVWAWPRCFERMETPQLWRKDKHWHLSFGGVLHADVVKEQPASLPQAVRKQRSHQNYDYVSTEMGEPRQETALHYVATPANHYIMKVLPSPQAEDQALFTVKGKDGSAMSVPYRVVYGVNGELRVEAAEE